MKEEIIITKTKTNTFCKEMFFDTSDISPEQLENYAKDWGKSWDDTSKEFNASVKVDMIKLAKNILGEDTTDEDAYNFAKEVFTVEVKPFMFDKPINFD